MGKRGRARNRRARNAQNKSEGGNQHVNKDDRKPYQDIIRENDAFITYYKKQPIFKDDWDEFLQALKTDLPSTFRITASKTEAKTLLDVVENNYISECRNQAPADKVDAFFPLPWYPNRLAWQLGLTRKDIRRCEANYRLHNFLISETENGTISRQETVSMIPPLVLDVKPHHKVLDMCAAPGSKTAQLIEILHSDEDATPSGFVVANDIDNNRCYMLVHQAKRLNSPCMAIINHNAQFLPNMTTKDGEKILFDRILCDVPCSGDGTLRKNPDIWMKWTPANGLNQHGVQWRIARRGAELLELGGRLVYSTCSLNPIENEAVVARLLRHCNEALHLVNAGDLVKGLKYTAGVDDWIVGSRNLDFYTSFEEVDEKWQTTIRPEMFPPTPEEKEKFHLDKCMRIFPHYQDTGAFFVAVFEKTGPIVHKKEAEEEQQAAEDAEDESEPSSKRMKMTKKQKDKLKGYKEDPFVFFKSDEEVWNSIKSFYNISDDFDPQCLLTRCHVGKKKNIYFCSPSVRDLVQNNQQQIKFINTGVKTFVRCDNRHMACAFRLAHEGLDSISRFLKARQLNINREDLLLLLANTDPQQAPALDQLTNELQELTSGFGAGSCVLKYHGEDGLTLTICGWRGTNTLRVYVTDHCAAHYLRLLGGDFSRFDQNKFQKIETPESEIQSEQNNDHFENKVLKIETSESEKQNDSIENKSQKIENSESEQNNILKIKTSEPETQNVSIEIKPRKIETSKLEKNTEQNNISAENLQNR